MKNISSVELARLIKAAADIQLLDVRETWEYEIYNIGGTLLPLSQIARRTGEVEKEKLVIVYCQKGVRSHIAIQRLQNKFPFDNLINLTGGIDAWKKQFPG